MIKGVATVLVAFAAFAVSPAHNGATNPMVRRHAAEVSRIQHHLARVEQELRSRDTASLTPSQRRARQQQIQRLVQYREAGKFPHNHDFPDRRTPYFVDRHGTRCAMAYLIEGSGGGDIVELVSRTGNNATVMQLAGSPVVGPELAAWLNENGLTVEEAQRIQPTYGDVYATEDSEISTAYGAASVGIGALNLVSVGINCAATQSGRSRRWVQLAGLGTGAAGLILGAARLEDGEPIKTLGIVNMMVGTTAVIASVWALSHRSGAKPLAITTPSSRVTVMAAAGLDKGAPTVTVHAMF